MGKLEEFKKAAARRRAQLVSAFSDERNQDAGAAIAGGAAAGAVRGAGLSVNIGEDMEIGGGAILGAYLVTMGGDMHPRAKAAGAGMLAFEAGRFAENMVDAALAAYDDDAPTT